MHNSSFIHLPPVAFPPAVLFPHLLKEMCHWPPSPFKIPFLPFQFPFPSLSLSSSNRDLSSPLFSLFPLSLSRAFSGSLSIPLVLNAPRDHPTDRLPAAQQLSSLARPLPLYLPAATAQVYKMPGLRGKWA